MEDLKGVFYCTSFVLIVYLLSLATYEAYAATNGQPQVVPNSNLSSATTDAIDKTVRGMTTNNIDRLMSDTILPILNSSSSRVVMAGSNQSAVKAPTGGLSSVNSSDLISNNQNLKDANSGFVTDNGTILLRFQNPTDTDIVKRLDKIETIIQEYTGNNNVNTTAKSIEGTNNKIMTELREIKSSISGLSEIRPPNNSSLNFSTVISSGLVSGLVSAVAVFILLRVYSNGGMKLKELKLR